MDQDHTLKNPELERWRTVAAESGMPMGEIAPVGLTRAVTPDSRAKIAGTERGHPVAEILAMLRVTDSAIWVKAKLGLSLR